MKTTYIDEPNMVVPLAASYNTRGNLGYTQAVNSQRDQRKVNSIYEPVKNALTGKTTLYLAKRPGVQLDSTCGVSGQVPYLLETAASGTSPWVFSVSSGSFRVSSTTSTVTISSASFNPAYVDKTSITGVEQVVLQVRSAGGLQRAFYASTLAVWTEISDSDFTGLSHQGKIEHLDGYAMIASRNPNRIYNSELNTLDQWKADSFITRRTQQDRATGLARLGSQILFFGDSTFEVYRNAGTPFGSPLEAVPELAHDIGLLDQNVTHRRHYYAVLDGWLYWISNNPIAIYAYNGSRVEKVSTLAIDKILDEAKAQFISFISFRGQRGIAVGIDTPDSSPQRALIYFPEWRDWFEWNSTVFIPQTGTRQPNLFIGAPGSTNLVLGMTRTAAYRDVGIDYTMTHQFKLPTNGNAHQKLLMFGVKGDTAANTTTSVLNVRFTTDDWQTSTAARSIDMTKAKKHIYRCGGFSDLGVYLDHTADLDCRMEAVVGRIE